MRKTRIRELSLKAFAPYGAYASLINPDTVRIGAEPIEFFRDMVQLDLAGHSIASFSVCRVLQRPPVIDVTEYHSSCGEGILPLDGDILCHVAAATPRGETPSSKIEVFRIPRGTFVSLRPGVWHHAPFAHGARCVNTLIVLPERTYANDCTVVEIPEPQRVEIVTDA
ncbi:MAG: ureidoglycolate lyase [Planctomycetota bacterium]